MSLFWTILAIQQLVYGLAWAVAAWMLPQFRAAAMALALSALCFALSIVGLPDLVGVSAVDLAVPLSTLLRVAGMLYISQAFAAFFAAKPLLSQCSGWALALAVALLDGWLTQDSRLHTLSPALQAWGDGAILVGSVWRIHKHFEQEFGCTVARLTVLIAAVYVLLLLLKGMVPASADTQAPATDLPDLLLMLGFLAGNGFLYLACAVFVGIRLLRQTEALSNRDALTGLLNRRGLQDAHHWIHHRYAGTRVPYSVVMLDIDHFKRVNDHFGHLAGDHVLELIGAELAQARASDVSARLGGEEFLLLLPDTPAHEAFLLAERLRERIAKLDLRWQGRPVHLTASLGLAQVTDPAETFHSVLGRADAALYKAKNAGRNRTALDPSMPTDKPH